jgi:hypothetical protein
MFLFNVIETAILVDTPIADDIPFNEYFDQFAPSYLLHPPSLYHCDNRNSQHYLDSVLAKTMEQLRQLECAPSVQMHYVPKDFYMDSLDEEADSRADSYDSHGDFASEDRDGYVENGGEYYDDDGDVDHDTENVESIVVEEKQNKDIAFCY